MLRGMLPAGISPAFSCEGWRLRSDCRLAPAHRRRVGLPGGVRAANPRKPSCVCQGSTCLGWSTLRSCRPWAEKGGNSELPVTLVLLEAPPSYLGVLELLVHAVVASVAVATQERCGDELRAHLRRTQRLSPPYSTPPQPHRSADLRGAGDGASDGHEMPELCGLQVSDAARGP